jgi:hypothetical protein
LQGQDDQNKKPSVETFTFSDSMVSLPENFIGVDPFHLESLIQPIFTKRVELETISERMVRVEETLLHHSLAYNNKPLASLAITVPAQPEYLIEQDKVTIHIPTSFQLVDGGNRSLSIHDAFLKDFGYEASWTRKDAKELSEKMSIAYVGQLVPPYLSNVKVKRRYGQGLNFRFSEIFLYQRDTGKIFFKWSDDRGKAKKSNKTKLTKLVEDRYKRYRALAKRKIRTAQKVQPRSGKIKRHKDKKGNENVLAFSDAETKEKLFSMLWHEPSLKWLYFDSFLEEGGAVLLVHESRERNNFDFFEAAADELGYSESVSGIREEFKFNYLNSTSPDEQGFKMSSDSNSKRKSTGGLRGSGGGAF